MGGGTDFMVQGGEQWSRDASEASRRFSVDNSGGSGLPLHLQGGPALPILMPYRAIIHASVG